MKTGSKWVADTLIVASVKRRLPVLQHMCRRTQGGQSLVKMAIALIVLVPLAAGVMQYIHIKRQTHASARAAAWEATVSPEVANRGMPDPAPVLKKLRAR